LSASPKERPYSPFRRCSNLLQSFAHTHDLPPGLIRRCVQLCLPEGLRFRAFVCNPTPIIMVRDGDTVDQISRAIVHRCTFCVEVRARGWTATAAVPPSVSPWASTPRLRAHLQVEPRNEPQFPLVGPASCVEGKGPVEWVMVTHFEQSRWPGYVVGAPALRPPSVLSAPFLFGCDVHVRLIVSELMPMRRPYASTRAFDCLCSCVCYSCVTSHAQIGPHLLAALATEVPLECNRGCIAGRSRSVFGPPRTAANHFFVPSSPTHHTHATTHCNTCTRIHIFNGTTPCRFSRRSVLVPVQRDACLKDIMTPALERLERTVTHMVMAARGLHVVSDVTTTPDGCLPPSTLGACTTHGSVVVTSTLSVVMA
jgi:hypothetical protein